MKRLLHDDDRGLIDILLMTVKPRQLDRRFIGLATGIAKEHFVHAGVLRQPVGQALLLPDLIKIGDMDETPCLLGERLDQARMGMPERIDGDARERVEIALAVFVKDQRTLSVGERDRQAGVGIHQVRHGEPRVILWFQKRRRLTPP